jgi:hypothetical protein
MRLALAVLVVAALPSIPNAQEPAAPDREAIVATVQKFFDTMAARDSSGARSVLMPEGRFYSVRDGNDQPAVRTFTTAEFLDRLAAQKESVRERFWNPEVRVHGAIAVVWTPYDFWIDGKFSHCGVDAFDLVKTSGGWKIAGGVYTVQREGCPTSPLGPLK